MILNLRVSIVIMGRVVLGDGSPSKITLYILKNNCTKFGAFVCFVTKFTTKQPDYNNYTTKKLKNKAVLN